jgi:hypothetical protein
MDIINCTINFKTPPSWAIAGNLNPSVIEVLITTKPLRSTGKLRGNVVYYFISWEANRFPASQEIPRILWNLEVHYRILKCPPPVSIQSQLNTVHTPTSYFLTTDLNPLTPELNPFAQRCLTRFFTGDFASWTVHFVNICVKNQQIHQLFIQFMNFVW